MSRELLAGASTTRAFPHMRRPAFGAVFVVASVVGCKAQPADSIARADVAPSATEPAPTPKPSTVALPASTPGPSLTASSPPATTLPELSPRVARVCAELALTQRRIFAAAWSEQDAPEIVPAALPVAPPSVTAPPSATVSPSVTAPPSATVSPSATAPPSASAAAPELTASTSSGTRSAVSSATQPAPSASAPSEPQDYSDLDAIKDVPPVPEPFGRCMPTHDGAWFVAFDEAGRDEAEIKGRWSILHIDRAGKIDSVQPATEDYVSECKNEHCTSSESYELVIAGEQLVSSLSASVFDWNSDGKDELFVHLYLAYLGGGSEGGRIWAYRKRAIELHPAARDLRVTGLSDVDTDGRPDVLVTLGSGVRMSPCTSRRAFADTLELVGHALGDGTFSFEDEVAIGFAKRKCPRPAARLTSQVEALCARVWGQSSEHVAAALDRGCKALKDVCDTDCEDRDALSYVTHDLRIPVVIPPNAR